MYPFLYIFLTPKIYLKHLKSSLVRSILDYYHFCNIGQLINPKHIWKYLDNYLGQLINLKDIRNI